MGLPRSVCVLSAFAMLGCSGSRAVPTPPAPPRAAVSAPQASASAAPTSASTDAGSVADGGGAPVAGALPIPDVRADGRPSFSLGDAIVSADLRAIFVSRARSRLSAIDPATGSQIWSAADNGNGLPLVAYDGRLLVLQGGSSPLVVLDARTGALQRTCDPVVVPYPHSSPYGNASVSAFVHNGKVYVLWRSDSHHVGGVPPTPEQEAAARRSSRGLVEVDLASGHVAVAPDAIEGELEVPAAWFLQFRWTKGPFIVGKTTFTLGDELAGGREIIWLRRSQAGTALADVALVEGSPGLVRAELSQDAHHVAIVRQLEAEKRPGTIDYLISLRACDTGTEIAHLETSTDFSPFFVNGATLYTFTGRDLRALALPGFAVRWTVPIITGPPPSPPPLPPGGPAPR